MLPGPDHVRQPGAQRLVDARGPVLGRDQVGGRQAAHVLGQQRVVVHGVAEPHRVLDLLLHQLEALQGRLAAAQVQGGEDLVVRRRRGVRHVGLVEGLLDLLAEVLVRDVDHRALAQRGQRLVGGLGGVDADPGAGGIGQQPPVQQHLVVARRRSRRSPRRTVVAGAVFGLRAAGRPACGRPAWRCAAGRPGGTGRRRTRPRPTGRSGRA